MKWSIWGLPVILSLSLVVAADSPFRKAPPEVEEALRSRVESFYSLFQQRQFRKAEGFVVEESKDEFYNAPKTSIQGFEISSLNFNDDFQEARVLISVKTIHPMMGPKPISMPVTGRWKWVDEDWYLYIAPKKPGGMMNTPFGPRKIPEPMPGRTRPQAFPGSEAMTPEMIKKVLGDTFRVEGTDLRFESGGSEPVTQSVTIHNNSKAGLEVSNTGEKLRGVEITSDANKVKPEGEMRIFFTYHPEKHILHGDHTVEFVVRPLMQTFSVNLHFVETQAAPQNDPAPGAEEPEAATLQP